MVYDEETGEEKEAPPESIDNFIKEFQETNNINQENNT
jgi:hypothetical protein